VGSRWTNAVAIRTPVPKCLERKRKRCGIGSLGKRLAMIGKEHAMGRQLTCLEEAGAAQPKVLRISIMKSAATCIEVL
jgi:hypothetical protein